MDAPLKPRPQQHAATLFSSAPTCLPNAVQLEPSLTDVAIGTHRTPLRNITRHSRVQSRRLTAAGVAVEGPGAKAARNNPEYVLGHVKRQPGFIRKPVTNEDYIMRATRLIEAERMTTEVDEALKAVKDGFAAEMDRCMQRKQDSVRKNQALMTAMKDFSHFIQMNDHWIAHNRKRQEDDERLTAAYNQRLKELQLDQEAARRNRYHLRQRWKALLPYEAFFNKLLTHITGYNDLEHFAAEIERQTAIIECTKQTVVDLEKLRTEAEAFHGRLDEATTNKLMKLNDEIQQLEEGKVQLEKELDSLHKERQQDLDNRHADIKEYLQLVIQLHEIYQIACGIMGITDILPEHKNTLLKAKTIETCLNDSHIITTAIHFVYGNTNWREIERHRKVHLDEIGNLVGSGYFPHIPYKHYLRPAPFVPVEKVTITKPKESTGAEEV